MKRLTIILDERLVARARKMTGIRTTRELVDRALRELVGREERRRMVERLRGSGWVGSLDAMRRRRYA